MSERLCLQALNYDLVILSSYDILNFFLINGIVTSLDNKMVDHLYSLSFSILNFFMQDIRSLDFSHSELAIASLLTAGYMTDLKTQIKSSLTKIYQFEIHNFTNATFVIKK
jgi:hypothetical protein